MGPYEDCWCRSGKKYKWCHFRREQQKPINIFELEAKMLAQMREGYCSHPDPSVDPCSPIITKAHTVQKNGGLAAIAEAGHVLTVKPSMKELVETGGLPQPRKVGVNNASVFPGFCSKHDTTIFKAIEGKSLLLTKDNAFLFAYRAISYERFSKEAQLRNIDVQREMDRGHPFMRQAYIQMHLDAMMAGIRIGMRDVDRWKAEFDARLLSADKAGFNFVAVRFDKVLPIVACGAFHPEFDLQGNAIQQLGRDGVEFDHITLTVTAFEGQTMAVFGWIGLEDGPADALAKSFLRVDDAKKADVLVRLLFIQTENLYLRQSWWDALSGTQKQELNDLTRSGTMMRVRSGAEMAYCSTSFVSATVVEITTSMSD
ncbi:SEC-C domain-containing protein [Rhizobium laguerreae]|uniref:SEC-C domain-containing protein n=1 Tax=Rhizobium laguerreae TaxID=1076926 RepID=UPI0021B10AD3|nr:SEC-C domain-containing protein [Rhizobium laguerreae]